MNMLLSIAYDPSVLHALQVAFPTPPNRAKQKLDKYLDLLQRELRLSLLRRTEIARKLNAYDLPLSILHNKGPTLGNRKFRVHAWLNKNGFALVTNINKNANNLTKEIALVKPTSLLVVNHANLLDDLRALTDIELTAYLDTLTLDWASVVNAYQSVYNSLSPQVLPPTEN